jgi:hypothetical protein
MISVVLAACSVDGSEDADGVALTVNWKAACVELWDGNELLAISSFSRAHLGEWDEPREGDYSCELSLPEPPTITLPPLAPGMYQICDQGRSDCRVVAVPQRET